MGQIKNTNKYPVDIDVKGNELLIGSDIKNKGKTKNYRLSDLAKYFSEYFASSNQSVKLVGNVKGGDGVTIVETQVDPSIISDKPDAVDFAEGGKFLYLENGILKQIDSKLVIDNSGGYVPPVYTPFNLTGDSYKFIQNIETNDLGHVVNVSLGNIPNASSAERGLIRIAAPNEYYGTLTDVAVPPAALSNYSPVSNISGDIDFLPKFVGTNEIGNSVIKEVNGKIGVGATALSEKLTVDGLVFATGFKSTSNDHNKIFLTDGGEASCTSDVKIIADVLVISPLNLFTGSGSYVIPTVKNKFVYITYDGSQVTDNITLPSEGVVGQLIYLFHGNNNTNTIPIFTPNSRYEFDRRTGFVFYWNGENWMVMERFNMSIG